ncbi:MAG: chromosome segregation protein SMC [Planctomycetes bacterium]|nr:chromosome segregation protein SMC [Planctomycetota bacterium]
MRIVKLEMDGFKSFGRPVSFEFTAPITGVVGPNGCGKSNVVDATRWVLGEMSRKALRAGSSTDVIFSGSATRKPANRAEVSITFDNSCGTLPLSSRTVKITRRLQKNGDSEYLLNDEPAKLRDIKGLIEGTGAGMSAYSIMEQGKMDSLIQSNPDDRRRVFEEAAGIGNMRKQQEAAQQKLVLVEQNLEKLQSILSEVKGQLKKIKSQATRALRFTELKERARVIHLQLALAEFARHDKSREDLLATISAAGQREGAIQADLAKTKMDLEDAQTRLADAEHEERRLSERIHKLELEAKAEEAKRERALSRIESLKQAIDRARDLSNRIREQMSSLKSRRTGIEEGVTTGRAELAEISKRVAELAGAETAAREQAEALEAELKQTRTSLLDAISAANKGLNERMKLEADTRAGRRRLESLQGRANTLGRELADSQARRDQAFADRDQAEAALAALKAELADVERRLAPANARASELRQKKHSLELKRGGKVERRAMLASLCEDRGGLHETAHNLLKDDARRAGFGVQGQFADGIRIDLGFAAALERVLDNLGGAIVVDTLDHAHDLFDWLAGRGCANVAILAREKFAAPARPPAFPGGKGVIGPLLEVTQVDDSLREVAQALLSDVLLVADRSVARRLLDAGNTGFRIVTPTGELFSLPGAFRLAGAEANTGLITQQAEIDRLDTEVSALDTEILEVADKLAEADHESDTVAARGAELRNSVYDASMGSVSRRVALESLLSQCARLAEEQGLIEVESSQISRQLETDLARHNLLEQEIAGFETERSRCETALARLNDDAGTARNALQDARNSLTDEKVKEAARRSQLAQAEDSLKGIDSALARYADDIARGATEVESHAKEIRKLDHEAAAGVEVQAELEREQRELEARRGQGGGELARSKAIVEAAREKVDELNEQLYAEREGVQQARIDENTLFMKMDAVRRRMAELYNADLDTLYREYDPAAAQGDEATARAELEAVEDQLRKLGNVNLEAMDELKDAEERNDFYARQETDLLRAKRTLADAILKIERETRRMFLETFEKIRSNFARLFRRMFGGGSADILLTNPEEPLTSGVEIIAKPPGKEALPISMRSGGERAMISVAMMFAIYETNPAPFAILDEVDAPLDEANVDRFCTVVADYAKVSQFIIITHHKKTMAACDTLYGVTMQEPGTSTRVSVDLRDVRSSELVGAGA